MSIVGSQWHGRQGIAVMHKIILTMHGWGVSNENRLCTILSGFLGNIYLRYSVCRCKPSIKLYTCRRCLKWIPPFVVKPASLGEGQVELLNVKFLYDMPYCFWEYGVMRDCTSISMIFWVQDSNVQLDSTPVWKKWKCARSLLPGRVRKLSSSVKRSFVK